MANTKTPDQLSAEVTSFLADARQKAAGGITVAEFGTLTVSLLHLVASGLDSITTLDGPAKKAWSIACVGLLFDAVATSAVPFAMQPVWLICRPAIRSLVLAAAGGALEKILALSRASIPVPEPTA